jgi:hypothetical protein
MVALKSGEVDEEDRTGGMSTLAGGVLWSYFGALMRRGTVSLLLLAMVECVAVSDSTWEGELCLVASRYCDCEDRDVDVVGEEDEEVREDEVREEG